jgi:hypothetical protein
VLKVSAFLSCSTDPEGGAVRQEFEGFAADLGVLAYVTQIAPERTEVPRLEASAIPRSSLVIVAAVQSTGRSSAVRA